MVQSVGRLTGRPSRRAPLRVVAALSILVAGLAPLATALAMASGLLEGRGAWLACAAAAAVAGVAGWRLDRRLRPVGRLAESVAGFIEPRRAGSVPADDVSRLAHGLDALARRVEVAERKADPSRLEDPLTGLPNRLGAMRKGRDEISRARRTARGLCVALIEVDNLAALPDEQARGRILRMASETIVQALRAYDLVARWDGDTFLAMLPEAEIEHAVEAMRRVRDSLSQDPFIEIAGARATICAGVAVLQPDDATLGDVAGRAATALDKAKRRGAGFIEAAPGPRTRPGRITSV